MRTVLVTTLLVSVSAASCGSKRGFIRVEELAVATVASPRSDEYRIGVGDVLSVRVWNQEGMSTNRARVRDDGKISIPFLQDVEVARMTPNELGDRLQVRLKPFIVNPVVTVTLEERAPLRISVLGEVAKPGSYDLPAGATVLHALAVAGGLSEFARRDGIYLLRYGHWADGDPSPARIRFRWSALSRGTPPASTFPLRSGDVVVVE